MSPKREKRAWNAGRLHALAHGHLQMEGKIELADGRRGHFLGCNGLRGNFALLNTQNLKWEWLKN